MGAKTLLKCALDTVITSSQFELSTPQLAAVDIASASRKAQHVLPFQLKPGASVLFVVYCTARCVASCVIIIIIVLVVLVVKKYIC